MDDDYFAYLCAKQNLPQRTLSWKLWMNTFLPRERQSHRCNQSQNTHRITYNDSWRRYWISIDHQKLDLFYMNSSSQHQQIRKSPRRRRKHSRNRKSSASKKSEKASMGVSEPSSPSSPFSWRLERKSSPSKKSHGIAPSRFHAKLEDAATADNDSEKKPPVWKTQIERNLLIQQQKEHTGKLEAKRKEFRKTTQLKTWPLQDMA